MYYCLRKKNNDRTRLFFCRKVTNPKHINLMMFWIKLKRVIKEWAYRLHGTDNSRNHLILWRLTFSSNFFFNGATARNGPGPPHFEVSWSHSFRHTTFGRTPLDEWSAQRRDLYQTTHNSQQTDIHAPGGIRIHNPSNRTAADLRLRRHGHCDRLFFQITYTNSSQRTHSLPIIKIGLLNLSREIVRVYCKQHIKHKYASTKW